MAVIAKWKITTRDKTGSLETYFKGDLIDNLTNQEEKRLLEQGAVTKVLEDNKKNKNKKKDGE